MGLGYIGVGFSLWNLGLKVHTHFRYNPEFPAPFSSPWSFFSFFHSISTPHSERRLRQHRERQLHTHLSGLFLRLNRFASHLSDNAIDKMPDLMRGSPKTRSQVKLWGHLVALTLAISVTSVAVARMLITNSQRKAAAASSVTGNGGQRSMSGQIALSMVC